MWIFGSGRAAECVISESVEAIEGVCLDDEHAVDKGALRGYPITPISSLVERGMNSEIFVAMGYRNLNRDRAKILSRVRDMGFGLVNVLADRHLKGNLEVLGVNNFIMSDAIIQPYVTIGNNNFIWSGSTICHHCTIEDNVWITAGVTIAGGSKIGSNVFIGANATVGSEIVIGSNVFIGAGALVVSDVPSNTAVVEKSTDFLRVDAENFVKYLDLKGRY
jgi:sugar O-acyltransferase (sialic acid O-acetyltransferase NeuD family)